MNEEQTIMEQEQMNGEQTFGEQEQKVGEQEPANGEQEPKKKPSRQNWKLAVGFLLGVAVCISGAILYRGYFTVKIPMAGVMTVKLPTYALFHGDKEGKLNRNEISRKLEEIEYYLDEEYYYSADKAEITEGLFHGLADSMEEQDPYTRYYTRKEFSDELTSIEGTYTGVGVTVSIDPGTGGILVEAVTPDGPAEEAGIRNRDLIIKADGVDLRGMTLEEATGEHIKGEEGTEVLLTVLRNGEELEISVVRKKLSDVSVYPSTMEAGGKTYGYLYITQFLATTLQNFTKAMDEFEAKNVDGVVVDLRSNPGGDMNIALDMLDYLLPDDLAVYTDTEEYGKNRGKTLLLTVEQKKAAPLRYYARDGHSVSIPIVVLVNEGSASASEIFTGVMRSYGTKSAGQTTYGKGIVQNVRMLYDTSGIKYTCGEYVLPSGEKIHKIGITPDAVAEATEEMMENGIDVSSPDLSGDTQLAAAVGLLKGELN